MSGGLPPSASNSMDSGKRKRSHFMVSYTNACSVGNKWLELDTVTKGSDVIGVTETWLKCDDKVDRFCPQGYVVYRADRPNGRIGSGVMLLIAQQYHQTQGPSLRSPSVQAISCALSVHRKKIMIAVIYRSPVSEKDEDESLV